MFRKVLKYLKYVESKWLTWNNEYTSIYYVFMMEFFALLCSPHPLSVTLLFIHDHSILFGMSLKGFALQHMTLFEFLY